MLSRQRGRADSLAREELGVRRISGRPSEFCHEGTIDLRVLTAPPQPPATDVVNGPPADPVSRRIEKIAHRVDEWLCTTEPPQRVLRKIDRDVFGIHRRAGVARRAGHEAVHQDPGFFQLTGQSTVSPTSPALAARYAGDIVRPPMYIDDELMKMIRPYPRAFIFGRTACVHHHCPDKSVSMRVFQCVASISEASPG